MKTITLNLAGNKVDFIIETNKQGNFKVMNLEKHILLGGFVYDNRLGFNVSTESISLFSDVLIKKVKTELRKLNIKLR